MKKLIGVSRSGDDDEFQKPKPRQKKTVDFLETATHHAVSQEEASKITDFSQLMISRSYHSKGNCETVLDVPLIGDGEFKMKVNNKSSHADYIANVTFSFGMYKMDDDQPCWNTINSESKSSSQCGCYFEYILKSSSEKVDLFEDQKLDSLNTSYYIRIIVKTTHCVEFDIEVWQKETFIYLENPLKTQHDMHCLTYRMLGLGEDDLASFDDGEYKSTKFVNTSTDLNLEPGSYFAIVKRNESSIVLEQKDEFSLWCSFQVNGVDISYCDEISNFWCSKPFFIPTKRVISLTVQAGQSSTNFALEGGNYDFYFLKSSSEDAFKVFESEECLNNGLIHFLKVMHDSYRAQDYQYANYVFNFFPSDKRIHHIKSKIETLYLEPLKRFELLKKNVNKAVEVKDLEEVKRLIDRESNYKDCIKEGLVHARSKMEILKTEKFAIDQIMRLLKKHGEEVESITVNPSFLSDTTFLSLEKTRQREKKDRIVSTMLELPDLFSKSTVCFALNVWYNVIDKFFSMVYSSNCKDVMEVIDIVENQKDLNLEGLEDGSFRKWAKILDIVTKDQMNMYLEKVMDKITKLTSTLISTYKEIETINDEIQAKFTETQTIDNALNRKLENAMKRRSQTMSDINSEEIFLKNHLFLYFEKSHKEFGIDVFNWVIPSVHKHMHCYLKATKAFCEKFMKKHQPELISLVCNRDLNGLLVYIGDNKHEMLEKDIDKYTFIHAELSKTLPNFSLLSSHFGEKEKQAFQNELSQVAWVDRKLSTLAEEYHPETTFGVVDLEWRGSVDVEPLTNYESIPYDKILDTIKNEMKLINRTLDLKDPSMRDEKNNHSCIGQLMRKRMIPVFMTLFLEDMKPEYDLWTFLEKIASYDTELEEAIQATNQFVSKRTTLLSSKKKDHIHRVKFKYFFTAFITNGKNPDFMPKIVSSSVLTETHKPTYLLHNKNNQKELLKYLAFFKTYPMNLELEIPHLEYDPKYSNDM
ncbi:hypothetical protein C9374_007958 [Naegleria lovaniensis]|uniref:Uncharacterized protein n=1 Tax=Naegleria lovaniensis TaxID=51637 RepID=A0AA88GKK1_NAELO|nr:uncharacterized protein C9374_007958 [Naegleria lovaniensis]KAG2378810.1 hypothetical protein C9374_007958 [Naegleria lovaniensis]